MSGPPSSSERTPNITARTGRKRAGVRWSVALCVLVWVASCWFLRGDLGRWNDDYFFQWINPATGAWLDAWEVRTTPFFPPETGVPAWRPLFFTLGPALNTVLWAWPAALHTIQSLMHLGMVCALCWLAAELGLSRRARVVVALIAIPCAPAFETVFWTMAWPTTFAMMLVFVTGAALARAVRQDRVKWGALAVLFALPVPLLNEQPAGAFLALPFLVFAARPAGMTAHRAMVRHGWVVAAIGAWCVLYAVRLVLHETPAGTVGASGMIVHADAIPRVTGRLLGEGWKDFAEWRYIRGGARALGWREMLSHPLWSAALLISAATGALVAGRWLARPGEDDRAAQRRDKRVGWTGLIALAMIAGGLVPLIAVDSPLRPRMLLCSWCAFALFVGACVDWSRGWIVAKGWPLAPAAWAGGAILAAFVASCSLSMIGVQRAYRDRWKLDERIGTNFRAAMPDPPPGTVFFMLDVRDRSLRTGNRHMDRHFFGALACSWSYPTFLKFVYQRADIECQTYQQGWAHLSWADEHAYVPVLPMLFGAPVEPLPPDCPPMKQLQVGVAWDKSVFVDIAEDGGLTLVEQVEVRLPNGKVVRVAPPRGAHWRGARTPLRVLHVTY